MQAILLCAGRGQRLAPITDTIPKPLVPVGGRALIDYQLEKLVNAGVKKVVINVAWLAEQIMQHVGNGSKYGLEVVYSVEPDGALETGGGVLQAMNLIDSDSFIVCNADVFHEYDFSQLFGVTSFLEERDDQAYLVLIENPSHNPDGDFCIDRDKIIPRPAGLPKRLDQVKSHKPHTYSGIGVYRKSFFIGLEQGRFPLGPLLHAKTAEQRISGELFVGEWFDAGTKERIQQIEKYIENNSGELGLIAKEEQFIELQ